MTDPCPFKFCTVSGLHGHGSDARYQGRRQTNPYVTGPPLDRCQCSLARGGIPHWQHIERFGGEEFLCEGIPVSDWRVYTDAQGRAFYGQDGCTTSDEVCPGQHPHECYLWRRQSDALTRAYWCRGELNPQTVITERIIEEPSVHEPTKQREGDQRLPDAPIDGPDDFVLYIADIEARRQVGIERYGQAHRPFNGRNTLLDAFEEVLDTGLYLRSLLRQAEADREHLVQVVYDALLKLDVGLDNEHDRVLMAETAVDRIMGWVVGQRQEVQQ